LVLLRLNGPVVLLARMPLDLEKRQGQGQTDQDGKWCHIHQSNLHDLEEYRTAIEMFGSKANTITAPGLATNSGTTVSSSVSSATGQAAFASALIVKTASPSQNSYHIGSGALEHMDHIAHRFLTKLEVAESFGLPILARSGFLTASC
jgi:hypothetical protein